MAHTAFAAWRLVLTRAFAASLAVSGCEAHVDVLGRAPLAERPREAGVADAEPVRRETGVVPPDAPDRPDAPNPSPEGSTDARPPVGDRFFSAVTSADDDTCGVSSGVLYCWGAAPDGAPRVVPTLVPGGDAAPWRSVSSGLRAHCAVRESGSVWCWGINDQGQLGQGDDATRAEPTRVTLPIGATRVKGRVASFCAALEDGTLYCWGANEEGQLAQNDPFNGEGTDRSLPVRVGTDADWVDIDVGQGHACGIRRDGSLYCWGRNSAGESGLGPAGAGQVREPELVSVPTNWTAIAAGQNHSCGIRTPGALYCFGNGGIGALGLGDTAIHVTPTQVGTDEDWTSVDLDTFHTCGIRAPGTLWCWGRNLEGQLGTGDNDARGVPTRIGDFSDWVQISVGRFHTCGRRRGGTVWCTGDNEDGRLGTGDVNRRNVFSEISPPSPG